MSNDILIALVSLCGSLIGTLGGIVVSSKLTTYRIEQLEKKVEQHNKVVDRTYELEKQAEVITEKIKVINHRIDDLESERTV